MSATTSRPLWPHQSRGVEESFAAEREARCVCVTSPTGGGKRTMILLGVRRTVEEGGRAVVFTNRRLLTAQTRDEFHREGIDFGVLSAGYDAPMGEPALVASAQTVRRRGAEAMPHATRVFIDEAHGHDFDAILCHYRDKGIPVHGYTATPVELRGRYQRLVVAGTNSELRKCGAIVPCRVFSPEQPDLKGVKRNKVGEYSHPKLRKLFSLYQTTVYANVLSWWKELNPFRLPTILFAPGVPESRWFVERLIADGVPAAHLDGETPDDERQRVIEGTKDGTYQVVSSYGVLREGADMPWIAHGILVQVCGALSTFLQLVGRIMRAAPGKNDCVLQDHSGAMWRHGSPNEDRRWRIGDTDVTMAKALQLRRRKGEEPEPIRCPQCGGERRFGPKCPHCNFEHKRSVRLVRMTSGELKEVVGKVDKRRAMAKDDQRAWIECLFAAGRSGRTVEQAAIHFSRKRGNRPAGLRFMPEPQSPDWQRQVGLVFPWTLGKVKQ